MQLTGDVLVLVLVTFVIVNVVLLIRSVTRAWFIRFGAPVAGQPQDAPQQQPAPTAPEAPERPAVRPAPALPGRDVLTGLDDVSMWGRHVTAERAGTRRFPRPVTIVRMELDGLDELVGAQGEAAGDRVVQAMADALARLAGNTDHIARLGHGGFGAIMPSTPDDSAVAFGRRLSRACEPWLDSGPITIRPAIGWATASGEVDLVDLELLAMRRMRSGSRAASRERAPRAPLQQPPMAANASP